MLSRSKDIGLFLVCGSYLTQFTHQQPSKGLRLEIPCFDYPKRTISGLSFSVCPRINSSLKVSPGILQRTKRSYHTIIEAPLPGELFYHRDKEIVFFKETLKCNPQISIISGPPDSGKTSLILHILKELSEKDQRSVLHFDLRERNFSSVNELELVMKEAMKVWIDRCAKVAKHHHRIPLDFPFKFEFGLEEEARLLSPIEKLRALFPLVSKQFPPHDQWSNQQSPILFIDEAVRLRALLLQKDGHAALNELFKWFVNNTKLEPRFHVVLASSDSFLHQWIANFIDSSRLKSYVLGHLSQNDAYKFWRERIITRVECLDGIEPPKFNDAFDVCQGNMFLLEKYFSQYCDSYKPHSSKSNTPFSSLMFSMVRAERAWLMNAFFGATSYPYGPNSFISGSSEFSKPRWDRKDFITLIERLATSENGFLLYSDLCDEIGKIIVDDFIETNIIQLRPTPYYSYDISNHPREPIVTAKTAPALIAMKGIAEDIKSGKL